MIASDLPMNLPKPIVLVGLMGSGKTAIGSRVAEELNLHFIDIDHYIEDKEGMKVSDIFAKKGEPYFREKEYEAVVETMKEKNVIISTGGGAFIQDSIREVLLKDAVTIWLRATLDVLVERVSRKKTRPLLEKGNKAEIVAELMEARYPIYAEAGHVVNTDNSPHEVVVDKVIEIIKKAA